VALDVIKLQVFSVNPFVVDIRYAVFILAVVDTVASMAIEWNNIPEVTYARK
jgi:hypothetical protein